jgi:hypothetical protein
MQVYSVVFFVARTLSKLDDRFVRNDSPNKWQPLKKSCCDRESGFDRT